MGCDEQQSAEQLLEGQSSTLPEHAPDDARHELAELLGRPREHNVLYDRDETGEYLQAYTESFAEGLFFEIVERRGYRGSAR